MKNIIINKMVTVFKEIKEMDNLMSSFNIFAYYSPFFNPKFDSYYYKKITPNKRFIL